MFYSFSIDVIRKILDNIKDLHLDIVDDVSFAIYIKEHTNITVADIYKKKPRFCNDNLGMTKLADYSKREYVAYRNHRNISYAWGNREADIEEIKNQIKYVNAHLIKNKFTTDYYQTLLFSYHLLFFTFIFGPLLPCFGSNAIPSSSSSESNPLLISQNSFEPSLKLP